MDFLKKLNINDSDDNRTDNDSQDPAPLGRMHAQPPAATITPPEHKSVFDKIGNALQGGNQGHSVPPVVASSSQEKGDQSVLEKISNTLGGGSHRDHHQPTPPPPPPPQEQSLFDKIGDALGGGSHRDQQQQQQQQQPPPKEGNFADKLANVFGGGSHTAQPPPPPPYPESLIERISDSLSGHPSQDEAPQRKEDEGILGKIGEAIGHRKQEPEKPQSFGDKINSVLGGGKKGEEKEGALDKSIDFVQEHILKEGQQKDETALEQLKDRRIADAIRHGIENVTGKDSSKRDDR